jgi:adenylate cyclase
MRGTLDYDRRFAEALRGKPLVLAYSFTNNARRKGLLPEPAVSDGTFQGKNIAFPSWSGYGANLPIFQKAAANAGHINPLFDFDGSSRRVPMLAEYQGKYYESLPLAMARALLDNPLIVPGFPSKMAFASRYQNDLEWLDLSTAHKTVRIPVDKNVATLIPYRGFQGSFRYVSAADVLSGKAERAWLKGKIVLCGTSAPGLVDLRATPVGSHYPGVEIHANMLAGILDASIKGKPAYLVGAEVLLLSFCVLLLAILLPRLSPLRATVLTSGLLLAVVALNLQLWSAGLVMPLVSTVGGILALYVQDMSWGYFFESRNKRKLTERFGQYVPPELVEKMAQDPDIYSMEGKNEELTVLFSDVRGFTSISEGLEPKELTRLMNEYLDSMTQVIRRYHGTLDKYMGDAIMAFWGAPVSDADHARHAVMTALEMQSELRKLDKPFIEHGWPPLKIGVGINTGNMTVGDMGSRVRMAYTVMGDAVNLGSRLEELTKQYGVGIIVSEFTKALAENFIYRELDRVRVKGKDKSVAIFEPVGTPEQVSESLKEELQLWESALRLYRSREWRQLEPLLNTLLQMNPAYHPYQLYTTRMVHFRDNPPGAEWDGVTTYETK